MDLPGCWPLLRRSHLVCVALGAIVVLTVAALTAFLSNDLLRLGDARPSSVEVFAAHLIVWATTALGLWGAVWLRDLLHARWRPSLGHLLLLDVVLLAAYAATSVSAAMLLLAGTLGQPKPPPGIREDVVVHVMVARACFLYIMTMLAVTSLRHTKQRRERDRLDQQRALREERLEAQLVTARMDALRTQLQPHFLFNALHAIGGLVMEGERREANEAIASLAALLRRSFHHDSAPTVTVREEVALLDQYLALEQIRLGERLQREVDVTPEAWDCQVPTMLLLPVVENAVRHGVSRKAEGGRVHVRVRCTGAHVEIVVHDDGVGYGSEPRHPSGGGVGLANCVDRLANMYGDRASLQIDGQPGRGTTVTIRVPHARREEPGAIEEAV